MDNDLNTAYFVSGHGIGELMHKNNNNIITNIRTRLIADILVYMWSDQ